VRATRAVDPVCAAAEGDARGGYARGWRQTGQELHTLFADIRGILVDAEGGIYVLDTQAAEIRVFDARGRYRYTIGQEGAGPREFRGPVGMAWDPDGRIWVADPGNARYSVFTPAGDLVETIPHFWQSFSLLWPGVIDDEGRVCEIVLAAGEWPHSVRAIERLDPKTGAADSFPLPPDRPAVYELPRGKPYVPFTGRQLTALDPRGSVWVARSDVYRIVQRTIPGDTLLVIERAIDPVPVTPTQRAAAIAEIEQLMVRMGRARLDYSRIPGEHPILERLLVDDAGRLWVRHATADSTAAFDIFDRDGVLVATATAGFGSSPLAPVAVRSGSLYAVVRDSLDVQYVVRGRIPDSH
jgi:streptogramin lyase